MQLTAILETSLYVRDLEAAQRFYSLLLGYAPYSVQPGRHVFYRLESAMLLLFAARESRRPDGALPPHGAEGAGHVAFRVPGEDIPSWREQLQGLAIPVESDWTWPNGAASIYFRDPDGNLLEITTGGIWGFSGS